MTEALFYWLAMGCYVLSTVAYIAAFAFGKDNLRKWGVSFALIGLLLHSVSIGVRWNITGHGPYISTYEILSSTAWTAVLFFLILQYRLKGFSGLGALVMPLSFLIMGFALLGSREARMLPPSLRSAWLVIHVIFAKLTVAAMLVAVALSIVYLLKTRKGFSGRGIISKFPTTELLDDYIYRLVAFGFVSLTIMIITGVIWGYYAWGSYWSWDPAQTWSLVAWLVYGIYLHGRMTFRWRGAISALYIILAFIFLIAVYFIIPYFVKSQHSQYMVD